MGPTDDELREISVPLRVSAVAVVLFIWAAFFLYARLTEAAPLQPRECGAAYEPPPMGVCSFWVHDI